jgi:mannose-1-phosphate guanylyltransferase
MVLAAGFGTRLRPLTDERPKPLVPLGDRPLLAHILDGLRQAGASRVVVNAHHLSTEISNFINTFDSEVDVIIEESILGTAGGVAGARPRLGVGPIIVHNGDIVANVPWSGLLQGLSTSEACLALARRPRGAGTVGVDAEGGVVRLRGELFGDEGYGGDFIGVLALGPQLLEGLPEQGCLVGDVLLPRLREGLRVRVAWVDDPWSDVGDLESYLIENIAWLKRGGRNLDSWVAPGASVDAGVTLEATLVGAGARIEGSGTLRRCVVWPGARVQAPLTSAIVTTRGRLVPVPSKASSST